MPNTKTKIAMFFFTFFSSLLFFFSCARAETLKIGFVTDWEYGTKKEYDHKLPSSAAKYLKTAVNHFNSSFHPDLAVGGGDYILSRGISRKKAVKQMKSINAVFKKASAPRLYCLGNHDLSDMSESKAQESLGIDYSHSVTDINGLRVITLDTNHPDSKGRYNTTGIVSPEELAWLEEMLNTELPVIVFSHHSPVQTLDGRVSRINIYSANLVRDVLEKYDNVVAVFSGHHAVNFSTEVNGINYIIINNLTDKKAKGAYADIIAEKDGNTVSVSVSQFGKKTATYSFSRTLANDQ